MDGEVFIKIIDSKLIMEAKFCYLFLDRLFVRGMMGILVGNRSSLDGDFENIRSFSRNGEIRNCLTY